MFRILYFCIFAQKGKIKMNKQYETIYALCVKNGISIAGLCNITGISKSAFTELKSGRTKSLGAKSLSKIADHFNVSADYLMSGKKTPSRRTVPVYGQVSAGIPIEAITDIEDYEEITDEMASNGEYIALKIHGHSMEPRMCEGDVIIVRLQADVEDGQFAVVMVNGEEATCKKIKKLDNGGIALLSTNPLYEPQYYPAGKNGESPVRILGRVVEIRCKI